MSSTQIPHGRPRPQSDPSNAELHANTKEIAVILGRLEQIDARRIPVDELHKQFGIAPQSLDLHTGEASKHGESFIEPVASSTVNHWIAHYQPQKADLLETGPFEFENPYPAGRNEFDPSRESIAMKEKIFNYVRYSRDWKIGNILEKQTGWRSVNWAHLYRGDSLNDWQVSEVFVSVDPSQCDSMRERFDLDPRYPHMQAWLHDTIPVANDMSLTVAELSTVLTLALIVISRPVYRRALTMPITVFSCSDRQLRIVQGGIDFRNRSMDIRISRRVDFTSGGLCTEKKNKDMLLNILGWVCGKPVGKVMP